MPKSFIIRFAGVLLVFLILAAIAIHFLTSGDTTIVMWIFTVPFILGIPILTSVILATDTELEIPTQS
ncbi:hypothetical protein [Acinetobacter larvae]|uniref:Uncharacterized protein n=1 Tax=Acinetobacter larvae TaxID=1789224 RepID=A0A1B2LZG6_9GAMM|nr:hypothetical protein [Acinetobacter larvae]AOA58348.1 hypothetical protein BFG52_08260 [Acinetobacter larvae]